MPNENEAELYAMQYVMHVADAMRVTKAVLNVRYKSFALGLRVAGKLRGKGSSTYHK
jgi:hypothetical protein